MSHNALHYPTFLLSFLFLHPTVLALFSSYPFQSCQEGLLTDPTHVTPTPIDIWRTRSLYHVCGCPSMLQVLFKYCSSFKILLWSHLHYAPLSDGSSKYLAFFFSILTLLVYPFNNWSLQAFWVFLVLVYIVRL